MLQRRNRKGHMMKKLFLIIGLITSIFCTSCSKEVAQQSKTNNSQLTQAEEKLKQQKAEKEQKKKEAFTAEYEQRVKIRMAELPAFDKQSRLIAEVKRRYKIDLPALFPDPNAKPLTLKQIKQKVHHDAKTLADKRFTEEQKKEYIKSAQTVYPYYTVGSKVNIRTRNGRELSGYLESTSATHIVISGSSVKIEDIVSPSPKTFIKKQVDHQREHYLRTNFYRAKETYYKKRYDIAYEDALKQYGYIRKNGKIINIQDLIKTEIMPEIDKQEAQYLKNLEADVRRIIYDQMVSQNK